MTDEPVLLSDDRDWVRTLTLNRPCRKNAINPELWIALRDALNAAGRDRSVRALVITGSGGSFCSGADISVPDDVHPKYKLQRLTDVALALHELPMPTVAKVTGVCQSTSAVPGCCRNSSACNRPSASHCWPTPSTPRKLAH